MKIVKINNGIKNTLGISKEEMKRLTTESSEQSKNHPDFINIKQMWESYYGQWESSLPEHNGKSAPSPVCLSYAYISISAYSSSVTHIYCWVQMQVRKHRFQN